CQPISGLVKVLPGSKRLVNGWNKLRSSIKTIKTCMASPLYVIPLSREAVKLRKYIFYANVEGTILVCD
ncbi:hypothetical protein F0Y81_21850, partial [Salmonella enterica]|nr:hypothetical protein [Salmonella enterica]